MWVNHIIKLEKEAEAAKKLGIQSNLTDSIPLPLKIKGALVFENQAEFHPRKYLLPLTKTIVEDGSYIFENTEAVDLEWGNPCVIKTREGKKIKCQKVIIASHFPFYDGFGFYFTRLRPDISYVVALKIREEFPEASFINAEEPGRSLRASKYGNEKLILVGGEGHKTGHGGITSTHYDKLIMFAKEIFDVSDIVYKWSTQDYYTLDGAPYAGRLTSSKENVYVATGFAKWGMTNATASALLICDLILKGESPYSEVYDPTRFTLGASAKNFVVENFDVAKEFVKGKVKPAPKVFNIEKGHAKIVNIEGNKYGAYKDENGIMHIVDSTCTHLGCELIWNNGDKTWDCPCHGSRFSYEGDIVEGPALKKLNHYKQKPNDIEPNIEE